MVDNILLKENASHGAAILAGCTVLQEPDNIVHGGFLEFAVNHGSYMTRGQSDCLNTVQILIRDMMNNPIADLQGNQDSDVKGLEDTS